MIKMRTWIVENSRSGNRSSRWRAITLHNGRIVSAVSRNGAPNALARILREKGAHDQPVEIFDENLGATVLKYRSLHDMAKWTFREDGKKFLHRQKWQAFPGRP